jgi:RIO-like serine/threonine protein kinase
LHGAGIYFRSLHLGNIVVTPDNEMGLIDVADMRFLRAPLNAELARRNLQHFARYIAREAERPLSNARTGASTASGMKTAVGKFH